MILFKYFSRQVFATMLAVTCIVLVVSIGSRFSAYLNEAASGELTRDVVVMLLAFRIPKFLELIVPIGFFVSIMLSYGRLYVDSEMVVLESCGLSPKRLVGITLILAVGVMVLEGGLSLWLKPYGERQAEQLLIGQRNMTEFDTLVAGRFQSLRSGKRVTYAEDFTDTGNLSKVFMSQYKRGNFRGPDELITMVSETGETRVDENGNRFLVLIDGHRYSGKSGQKDYQVIKYEEYGQLIEKEQGNKRRQASISKTTAELMGSENAKDIAEFQWRFSVVFMVPMLALIAIPLSKVHPRQGRFTRIIPAMLLCFLYIILLSSIRSAVAREKVPVLVGLFGVHGVFAVIVLILFQLDRIQRLLAPVFNLFRRKALT